jgi:hypothetical protein
MAIPIHINRDRERQEAGTKRVEEEIVEALDLEALGEESRNDPRRRRQSSPSL